MVIIEAKEIKKDYYNHKLVTPVIKGINLSINKQDFISIVGPSGSGKTTLLYLLSGLENYTSGNITLLDKNFPLITKKKFLI